MKSNKYMINIITVSSIILLGCSLTSIKAKGQNIYLSEKDRTIAFEKNLWHSFNNAAGLGASPMLDNGKVETKAYRDYGDYRRAQEGTAENNITLYADQYKSVNDKIFFWGRFNGAIEKEYNRAWSDAYDTRNQNPYMYGSNVKGCYLRQIYDFSAKMATKKYGRFNYGIKLDFKVVDQSRINDPRPRTLVADYAVSPSIILSLNTKHSIGVDARYRFVKEKLTGINTVQESKNFVYYDFLGLENYREVSLTSFWRNTRSYHWGGEIQYAYNGKDVDLILNLNYEIRQDKVQSIQQSSPGDFKSSNYGATFRLTFNSKNLFHVLNANVNYNKGFSNYFRQEARQATDEYGNTSKWWETVYKALTYRNERFTVNGEYKFYFVKGTASYKRYINFGADYKSMDERYILPKSERNISLIKFNSGYADELATLKNGSNISYKVNLLCISPIKVNQELSTENVISKNIYDIDFLYFKKCNVGADIELCYNMGIKMSNGAIGSYFKVFGSGIFAVNRSNDSYKNQKLLSGGLAIGVILK